MALTEEQIAKLRNPDKLLPPAPHYPDWVYFCLVCQRWWEGELYHNHFVVTCPECQEKEVLCLS